MYINMDPSLSPPLRVCVYVRVTDVLGNPPKRFRILGDALCQHLFKRDMNAMIDPLGYDACHIPPDFDSETPVRRWFAYDLNVTSVLTTEEVQELPHLVFMASRQQNEL